MRTDFSWEYIPDVEESVRVYVVAVIGDVDLQCVSNARLALQALFEALDVPDEFFAHRVVGGEFIHPWRLDVWAARVAHGLAALLMGYDVDDVRLSHGLGFLRQSC